MAWLRLDDAFADHPKIVAAGPLAGWLHVCGLLYSARLLTDGFIPAGQVRKLADVDAPLDLAEQLCRVGLWEACEGGYQIHDYLEYNPSREETLRKRDHLSEVRSEAGRAGGIASGKARAKPDASLEGSNDEANREANDEANREHTGVQQNGSPVPHPRPVPTPVPDNQTPTHPEEDVARARDIADDVAEILVQAPWINDESVLVAAAVRQAFTAIPDFNARDGPALALLFVSWKGYAKKPPTNWHSAWVQWMRKEVRDGKQHAAPNGRTASTGGSVGAVESDITRRGYSYNSTAQRPARSVSGTSGGPHGGSANGG